MSDFVRVIGQNFEKQGKVIFFKGLGLGSWLNLEHFMLGIPCTDQMMKESFRTVYGQQNEMAFFDKLRDDFVTERDFAFLKSLGINLLRVPFNYRIFIDDNNPGKWKEEGFIYFDRLMQYGEKYGIYILLDLHAVPGGQNPDWHSDNRTGYTQFWQYKLFRNQMVGLWGKIAEKYQNELYLLGYDLLNEPYVILDDSAENSKSVIQEFYEDATSEIRKYDKDHILFWEGDHFAMQFDCIGHIEDEQTAVMFHFYPTVWDDNLYEKSYDKIERIKTFERAFTDLLKSVKRFERPVICGEAGYETDWEDMDFTASLIRETANLFRKYQISFTLWSYKDARYMGLIYPGKTSAWMKLVQELMSAWDHDEDTRRAKKEIDRLCDEYYRGATEGERYFLSFRQRAILYSLQKKHVLESFLRRHSIDELFTATDSFLYEQCEHYVQYEQILKEFQF